VFELLIMPCSLQGRECVWQERAWPWQALQVMHEATSRRALAMSLFVNDAMRNSDIIVTANDPHAQRAR